MDINETVKWLGQYSIHMAKTIEMLNQYKQPSNENYLTDGAYKRYKGLALSLSFPLKISTGMFLRLNNLMILEKRLMLLNKAF